MKLLVDASVFITLAEIDEVRLLDSLEGDVVVPKMVADEIQDEPAQTVLEKARGDRIEVEKADKERVEESMRKLGRGGEPRGDAALLALASVYEEPVVVTDDKPLRDTCKAPRYLALRLRRSSRGFGEGRNSGRRRSEGPLGSNGRGWRAV